MFDRKLICKICLICVASFTDGLFQLAASYAGCNVKLAGSLFAVSIAAQGLHSSCTFVNPMDLSPNFAATISAMLYGSSSMMGAVAPIIFGALSPNVS